MAPEWTSKRLVPMAETTLRQLKKLATEVNKKSDIAATPLQVAAMLLEDVSLNEIDAENLAIRAKQKV